MTSYAERAGTQKGQASNDPRPRLGRGFGINRPVVGIGGVIDGDPTTDFGVGSIVRERIGVVVDQGWSWPGLGGTRRRCCRGHARVMAGGGEEGACVERSRDSRFPGAGGGQEELSLSDMTKTPLYLI